ncbi:hypothetical protein [Streptomyces lancefieldiae]|uniref:Uncharacterized protein n=1 Tax=Streptomyces lancefieldiae TaxID=3075520 RepID=A0ABU3ATS5_9ACTN|nr:hypothetical protein [Streptomyces sp. DSM 40712]MDT0613582.1 hypothetical protein [Streptomyces sp. DSM 40712]
MTEFRFELSPFNYKKVHGRKGVVGDFGEVTLEVERRKGFSRESGIHSEVRLRGENLPDTVYRTVGPGQPTLKNARLLINGHRCEMRFNSKGFRNASRALKLTYRERSYEYSVTRFEKGATLSRPGSLVTLTHGKSSAAKGMSTFGTATGEVDSIDLALAIVFEGVDTLELTATGAVSETLNRLLNSPRRNEPIGDY